MVAEKYSREPDGANSARCVRCARNRGLRGASPPRPVEGDDAAGGDGAAGGSAVPARRSGVELRTGGARFAASSGPRGRLATARWARLNSRSSDARSAAGEASAPRISTSGTRAESRRAGADGEHGGSSAARAPRRRRPEARVAGGGRHAMPWQRRSRQCYRRVAAVRATGGIQRTPVETDASRLLRRGRRWPCGWGRCPRTPSGPGRAASAESPGRRIWVGRAQVAIGASVGGSICRDCSRRPSSAPCANTSSDRDDCRTVAAMLPSVGRPGRTRRQQAGARPAIVAAASA